MKNIKFRAHIFYLSVLCVLFVACKSNDEGMELAIPNSITIQAQGSYTGAKNQEFQLEAIVKDLSGQVLNNQNIIWTSDDPSIASISGTGSIRLVSNGQVVITAAVGSIEIAKNIEINLIFNLIAFQISDLSDEMNNDGMSSRTFLDQATMSAQLTKFAVGMVSAVSSPPRDRIYYFYEGSGIINVNGFDITITEGLVLFISAGVSRQVIQVGSDMKIIIAEMKSTSGTIQSPFSKFTKAQTEATRNPGQNVWNPFLNERSATFGLYMLPHSQGGDGRLVHTTDELNIVVDGASTFETDNGTVSIQKGSVVFVRRGNGHLFNELASNIDILILWNK